MDSERPPIPPFLWVAPYVLSFVALFINVQTLRTAMFVPVAGILLHITTLGISPSEHAMACAITQLTLQMLDFLVLTDAHAELRLVNQVEDTDRLPFFERVKWVLRLMTSPRLVGWVNEPKNGIPPRPTDTSRLCFALKQLVYLAINLLVLNVVDITMTLRSQWQSAHELGIASGTWALRSVYALQQGLLTWMGIKLSHHIWILLVLATGRWMPNELPPLFSNPGNAITLRKFWGRTWHQMLRRVITSPSAFIANTFLHLPRHGKLSRYTQLYLAFFFSGLIHAWPEYMLFGHLAGSMRFFLLQALAIHCEDTLISLAGGMGVKQSKMWEIIGYIWASTLTLSSTMTNSLSTTMTSISLKTIEACDERRRRHTPLRTNSNPCSTNMSTKDLRPEKQARRQQKQDELQQIIAHELRGATFEGYWVRDAFFPTSSGIEKVVFDGLREKEWTTNIDTEEFVLLNWPEAGKGNERLFYEPLVKLFNAIIDKFKDLRPSQYQKSYFRDVRFAVYDRMLRGSTDSEAPLKPGFVALDGVLGTGVRLSWYQTLIVGDVKDHWGDLVAQAGIYARCLFAATEHRIFIPMFLFCQDDLSFRVCLYHRGGLLATTPMALATKAGFCEVVATIVGMWQWETLSQAGYDPCMSHSHISFNHAQYRITQVLCRRQVIRGRGTGVFAVKLDKELERPLRPRLRRFLPEFTKELLEKVDLRAWSRLNPYDDLEACTPTATKLLNVNLPESFIVKCSHQPAGRDKEEDIFRSVQGYIGIPDILIGYEAQQFHTSQNVPEFWPLKFLENNEDAESPFDEETTTLISDSAAQAFEVRRHRHLVIKTMGHPLDETLGPQKLARALQHAAMGHCALFTQGRYLHRDVSSGNIVVLDEPVTRQIPDILNSVIQSQDCVAFLIDGDMAKRWGSVEKPSHPPGTLPFLSLRISAEWASGGQASHTPIDDLESFAWVLLYELLHWAPSRTQSETRWWNLLNTDGVSRMADSKRAILYEWRVEGPKLSPYLSCCEQLLQKWFRSVHSWSKKCQNLMDTGVALDSDELMGLFGEAYKEFIGIVDAQIPLIRISQVLSR
ncbi:hypothetical protein EYR38_008487 [Pleurotus pulmonarius]|nr:hypothetical protein EYR38_008487 [Pleurotus pulmonarius]